MKKPCFNCPNRTAECHAKCEEYKAFRTGCDDIISKREMESKADPGISKERLKKMWREMKK